MDSREKFVITIGRQTGSGGLETAGKLARELGIKMYDQELITEVAKASGLSPEIFAKSDEKQSKRGLNGFFGIRLFSHVNEALATGNILSDDELFKAQSEVIQQLAEKESCVIVGRCADYILRNHPRMISVFITAELDFRVRRLMNEHGWNEAEARRFIIHSETKRADYYNYFTFKKWGDAASYDLCIDCSKVGGTDAVVEHIKLLMQEAGLIDTKQ